MGELKTRAISGIVIVACILGGIRIGGIFWLLIASAIALISLWEYYGLFSSFSHISKGIGLIAGAIAIYLAYKGCSFTALTLLLIIQSYVVLTIELIRKITINKSYALLNVGGVLSGLILVVLPWSFLVLLRQRPIGIQLLFSLFLCTWSCDVFAYLIGSKFGRTPFAPYISPKKTLEGFIGGLSGSILCAAIISYYYKIPPVPWILLGAMVGVAGQVGDLFESLFKREAGAKDSSSLIPGHGGFLDRFDSILINSTLIFLAFEVILN